MHPGKPSSAFRVTCLIVALASLVRLAVAGLTGLGIDESYMVAASERFCASYFDHPLASWWLELTSRWLLGSMAPIAVRLPFVLLAAISSLLLYALTERLYGPRAGLWAVLAYSLSPVFSLAFGCWVLPDGPLDAALLAASYALTRALGLSAGDAEAEPLFWLLAGFCAGLALLSKYSAVLVLAGALLFLLTEPRARRQLRTLWPWLGGLIALALFTPVIGWNAAHHWISFHYQGGRAGGLHFHPLAPLAIWGGEALFLLPWIWLPLVLLLLAALRRGPGCRRDWLLAMLGIIPIVLFAGIGLWSSTRVLYHWAAPGYLMLFPLLGHWAAERRGAAAGWLRAAAVSTALLLLAGVAGLVAELGFGVLPLSPFFPPGEAPVLQAIDWDSITPQLAERGMLDNPRMAIAALRWYDAGKIGYAVRGRVPVTVLGPEPHQFGVSCPPSALLGRDLLIIAMPGNISEIAARYRPYFEAILPAPALIVSQRGDILRVIPTLLGKNLLHAPGPNPP